MSHYHSNNHTETSKFTTCTLYSIKPGSQYNVNITLRQEVIQFSMGLVAGIEMISIPATVAATNPLKIV